MEGVEVDLKIDYERKGECTTTKGEKKKRKQYYNNDRDALFFLFSFFITITMVGNSCKWLEYGSDGVGIKRFVHGLDCERDVVKNCKHQALGKF